MSYSYFEVSKVVTIRTDKYGRPLLDLLDASRVASTLLAGIDNGNGKPSASEVAYVRDFILSSEVICWADFVDSPDLTTAQAARVDHLLTRFCSSTASAIDAFVQWLYLSARPAFVVERNDRHALIIRE